MEFSLGGVDSITFFAAPSCLLLSGLITSDFWREVSFCPLNKKLRHHGISSFVRTQNYECTIYTVPQKICTPPKINSLNLLNDGLEDDFPFKGSILRFHVNLLGRI